MKRALDQAELYIFLAYVVMLTVSMSGMEICSTLLCLVWFIRIAMEPKTMQQKLLPPFLFSLGAFSLVAVAGIFLGDATLSEKVYDLRRMRFFLVYAVVFFTLNRLKIERKTLIRVMAWSAGVVAFYGVVQHFIPLDLTRPEGAKAIRYAIEDLKIQPLAQGFFNHHLTFSNAFLFYAVFFFALGLLQRKVHEGYLALGLLLFAAVFWTYSRTAWVAIPVVVCWVLWWKSRKWAFAAVAGFAVLFSSIFLIDLGFRERLTKTISGASDVYSAQHRVRLWRVQFEMLRDYPILGIGYNNNERHSVEYLKRTYPNEKDLFNGHAHSTPLQILATTGLVGFALFLWWWFQIYKLNWELIAHLRKGSEDFAIAIGLFGGWIGFCIQGLTQWNFGDAEVLHNLFFFIAMLGVLARRSNLRHAV